MSCPRCGTRIPIEAITVGETSVSATCHGCGQPLEFRRSAASRLAWLAFGARAVTA